MKMKKTRPEIPEMAPANPSPEHAALAARYEQLQREARTAERYGHWAQSARLHREAARIASLIDANEQAA